MIDASIKNRAVTKHAHKFPKHFEENLVVLEDKDDEIPSWLVPVFIISAVILSLIFLLLCLYCLYSWCFKKRQPKKESANVNKKECQLNVIAY